jgi:hypothetical protein
VYGRATGLDPSSSFPAEELHFDCSIDLAMVGVVLVLAAVSTRRDPRPLLAALPLGSILAAAVFGQGFVVPPRKTRLTRSA